MGAMTEKPVPQPPDAERAAGSDDHHDDGTALIGKTSPGVRRIEAISRHFSGRDRWFLFAAVFLVAYVYGLDGTLRYTYQVGLRETHSCKIVWILVCRDGS